jgi:septal ring factor EnvC (AmiA/AmiB activator)
MRPRLILALALGLALPGAVLPGAVLADAASDAAAAAAALAEAVTALQGASEAKDRGASLTQTIKAYEAGLASMRGALRNAELRQEALTRDLASKRGEIGQLVGAMSGLDAEPGPLLLLHPGGPLGTVRSGMVLSDVTPALMAEAEILRAELTELATLQALQTAAAETLLAGMAEAQTARTALSQAISDRSALPMRLIDDPAALQTLLDSAETLDDFARGLTTDEGAPVGFAAQEGRLSLPVLGRILLRPGEPDAKGVKRPGLTLATRALAMVTAPWASTVRYVGPLTGYGNVMILEPGDGYLIVLAGLDTVYVETGQVVGANAPLGLMGGEAGTDADLTQPQGTGAEASQTLYLELRQGARPVDPGSWFGPIQ